MNSDDNIIGSPDGFPKVLYKFRRCDDENHLRMLSHNEIFLASPPTLNDPFDCRRPFRYDLGTKAQKVLHWEKIIKRHNPGMKKNDVRSEAKWAYKEGILDDRNQQQQLSCEAVKDKFGIFSLSKSYSNKRLWSRYSDSHKGFCVGFDKLLLPEKPIFLRNNDLALSILDVVNYCKELPDIKPYKMKPVECSRALLTHKTFDWEYEEEVRIILVGGSDVKVTLPDAAICRVIIGCDVTKDNKEKLIETIRDRKNKVHVYQAEPSIDEFKLIFKPLKLD